MLRKFSNIIKENLTGFAREPLLEEFANYVITKLKLCNIYCYGEYVQVFKTYYFLVNLLGD